MSRWEEDFEDGFVNAGRNVAGSEGCDLVEDEDEDDGFVEGRDDDEEEEFDGFREDEEDAGRGGGCEPGLGSGAREGRFVEEFEVEEDVGSLSRLGRPVREAVDDNA
ncbi:hypothetical protein HDU99_002353, partial [Rhizoclosmatium hyalinum]